jgi:hypothetical protein
MSRHKDKGRIEGPFVPMLIPTMESAAWKAMSPYARVVYYALKTRYGHKIRNNGRIYLSTRDGAEETGFHKDTIVRSLRELQHYGFIVMTEPGCLGVNGRGKAPHWRLTELGYMHEPPTKDFLKWDGELFYEQKSPKYYTRKKQNPVLQERTVCPTAPDIPVSYRTGQLPDKVSYNAGHINGTACPTAPDISRINHSAVQSDAPAGVVFQLPAVRPDSRAVDAYLAAWATDVPALALDLLLSDFGLSGSAR